MPPAPAADLRFLLRQIDPALAARLLALMLVSAMTEGFGLLLLVPVLGVLSGGNSGAGGLIGAWLAAIGIPLSIGPLLVLYAALVLLRALVNHARAITGLRFEIALIDGLRARAWRALLHCEWRVLSAMRQSENSGLLISSIDRIGHAVDQAMAAMATAITLAGLLLAACALSPLVVLAAALTGTLVLLAYRSLRRRAADLGQQLSQAYDDVHGRMADGLAALRVIKSFGLEDRAASDGLGGFARMRAAQLDYLRDFGRGQIALQGGGALALAVLVWLAITRWHLGLATILPLVALFARALPLLGALQEAWQNWAHGRPVIGQTMAMIDSAEAAREPLGDTASAPPLQHSLTFNGVSVCYSGRTSPALDRVSLTIPAGSILAISGPSGAGKSTLADLAGGLIAPDAGMLLIDGAPLADGQRRAWRQRVTYVQQEPVLAFGSIRDNLLWACPHATEADLLAALELASATFVAALPQGLNTRIGDGGRQLSGGERQRLVLARALLHRPALLILDEATSALDAENEAAVARALAALKGQLTMLIIGHRGPLAALADRSIVLEQGHLIGEQPE